MQGPPELAAATQDRPLHGSGSAGMSRGSRTETSLSLIPGQASARGSGYRGRSGHSPRALPVRSPTGGRYLSRHSGGHAVGQAWLDSPWRSAVVAAWRRCGSDHERTGSLGVGSLDVRETGIGPPTVKFRTTSRYRMLLMPFVSLIHRPRRYARESLLGESAGLQRLRFRSRGLTRSGTGCHAHPLRQVAASRFVVPGTPDWGCC